MATEIQTGKAKIFGLGAADLVLGAAAVDSEQTITGSDLSFDANISEIQNQYGDTETIIASNPSYTMTLTFMPTAETRALAITEAQKFSAMTHLVKVVTSGFDVNIFNGKWNVMGLSVRGANTDAMVFTLNLKAIVNKRDDLTEAIVT